MILFFGIFYVYLVHSDVLCTVGSLPSDTDDFQSLLLNTDTYVDKSLLIEEFLSRPRNDFGIIIRPRQWGKTLNLNMLEKFFDIETYPNGTIVPDEHKQNGNLFTGGEFITNNGTMKKYLKPLKIAAKQEIMKLQGSYPVINFKLSGINGYDLIDFQAEIRRRVKDVFLKFEYLRSSCKLSDFDKIFLKKYYDGNFFSADVIMSMQFLSSLLFQHFGRKAIVFIDDYDALVINAYQRLAEKQFEDYKMVLYVSRSLHIQSLHLNPYIERGLISGTVRLRLLYNPLHFYTFFDTEYSQYYGFNQHDLDQLLTNVSFTPDVEMIKQWYGYKYKDPIQFYNPGSVIRYIVHNGTFDYYWIDINCTGIDELFLLDFVQPDILNYLRPGTNYVAKLLDKFDAVKCVNYYNILLFFYGVVAPYRGVWNSSSDVCEMVVANLQTKYLLEMKLLEWVASKLNMTVDEFHSFVYQPQVDTIKQKIDQFRASLQPNFNSSNLANNDSCCKNISDVDLFYNALLLSSEKSISLNRAIYDKEKKDKEKFGPDFVSYFTKIREVLRFVFNK